MKNVVEIEMWQNCLDILSIRALVEGKIKECAGTLIEITSFEYEFTSWRKFASFLIFREAKDDPTKSRSQTKPNEKKKEKQIK